MFNIPADVNALPAGAGDSAGGKATAGRHPVAPPISASRLWRPCPPNGDRPHRYIFTIHALKVDHIDADQTRAEPWRAS
jgi:phosphatidylethanolamine-binding protein (PEBP) family uncharacterized protein